MFPTLSSNRAYIIKIVKPLDLVTFRVRDKAEGKEQKVEENLFERGLHLYQTSSVVNDGACTSRHKGTKETLLPSEVEASVKSKIELLAFASS
ncbi:MAG: hypothetical protein AB4038_07605 [Prochloraceae cyanobacterium]